MAEVIVALDMVAGEEALALVARLRGLRWVKVGSTLFVGAGRELVRELKARGLRVFLDLKWHDIPHQVAGAVTAAAGAGIDLATVHALGGRAMMRAAAEAAGDALRVVAVTMLTSHDAEDYADLAGRGATVDSAGEVARLTRMALAAGLGGVVVSAAEAAVAKSELGGDAWIVVPGIRLPGAPTDDQRRTADPQSAVMAGATHLVVGRPISRADDPDRVYQAICEAAS
ncbi:MAG: orotidine-5'-phosphate decarboxylase [Gemmatimonadales bacterium]